MKKVLLATTMLVATASMAAAEVKITGYGRFGLDYNSGNVVPAAPGAGNTVAYPGKTNLTSRLRIQFDMSAETDGGVALGARLRLQTESRDNVVGGGAANGTTTANGARFYARSGGFTLQVGNIVGAIEGMSGLYLETRTADIGIDGAGFESLVANVNGESFNWDAYSSGGTGVNGIEVFYSAGAFSSQVSYSQRNDTISGAAPGVLADGLDRAAINVSYAFGDWTAALGYQSSSAMWEDKLVVSVQGDLGPVGVRLAYADNDGIGKFGIYGNMDVGAASNILVYVTSEDAVSAADVAAGRNDNRDNIAASNKREGTGYGIHYSYDLGGGASFEAGARRSSSGNNTAQAGVYFSF